MKCSHIFPYSLPASAGMDSQVSSSIWMPRAEDVIGRNVMPKKGEFILIERVLPRSFGTHMRYPHCNTR